MESSRHAGADAGLQVGDTVESGPWAGFTLIDRYTRAQAIDDGTLVDVSTMGREAGFKVPVAMTTAVWHLVEPTTHEEARGQSASGRCWDVVWMAGLAARLHGARSEILYRVGFDMRGRPEFRNGQRTVTLKLHSGPGDQGEHVLTVMLPEED
jgi:hypothetical protein